MAKRRGPDSDDGVIPAATQLVFTTPNTSVRLLTAEDETLYLQLYMDANIMRYIGTSLTQEQAVQSFCNALKFNALPQWQRLFFVIACKENQQSFGLMGLTDTGDTGIEFGIMLSQQAQGQGLATEVLQQCMDVLFTADIQRVWLQLHSDNAAAVAMAQAAFMQKCAAQTNSDQEVWFIEQQHYKNNRMH